VSVPESYEIRYTKYRWRQRLSRCIGFHAAHLIQASSVASDEGGSHFGRPLSAGLTAPVGVVCALAGDSSFKVAIQQPNAPSRLRLCGWYATLLRQAGLDGEGSAPWWLR